VGLWGLRQTGKDWLVALLRRQRTGCSGLRVLAGYGFGRTGVLSEVAGLFQRISVGAGWTWLTVLALVSLRDERAAALMDLSKPVTSVPEAPLATGANGGRRSAPCR
jgi:hypothetical protein